MAIPPGPIRTPEAAPNPAAGGVPTTSNVVVEGIKGGASNADVVPGATIDCAGMTAAQQAQAYRDIGKAPNQHTSYH